MASRVAEVAQGIVDPGLEHRNRLWETLPVELDKLLGQSPSRLLAPDLEERLQILGHLRRRGGWHVREYVALKVHHAPLPPYPRQFARHRGLDALVVVRDHQAHSPETPVHKPP